MMKFIDMTDFQKLCLRANTELKNYIDTQLSKQDLDHTNAIGEGGDISAHIDLIAEKIFCKYLLDMADIYSEESGLIKSQKQNNLQIILDPLDGSDNLLHGIKYYGTSIALQKNGLTIDAMVYNLVDGTYYTKENFRRFNTTKSNLAIFERAYVYPKMCEKLSLKNIKFRSPGSIALSLCNVQNVDFVLFGGKIREFDLAAALYICEELHIYRDEEFLLVSKDIQKFDQIKEIIKLY